MSSPLSAELLRAPAVVAAGRWFGVYPATVAEVDDPARVKVELTWAPQGGDGQPWQAWARVATLLAGEDCGTFFMPAVDDEVLVAFLAGDPAHPYVIGCLWNGSNAPPVTMDDTNDTFMIRSPAGVTITLDDAQGAERLVLETPGGTKIELKDGGSELRAEDANGNSVVLDSSGITVTASAKVTVNASSAELTAGTVDVNAGMATFSGVVKCATLIADSVVGSSYTPGAGNIW